MYIGQTPSTGAYKICDAITTSSTATFNLTVSSVATTPETANHCIVSLNGVIQAPISAFTISGSTIVFASSLTSADVVDFILILGDVMSIGTPSDGVITNAKLAQDIISGETALAVIPDTTDEFLISNAGVLNRIDAQFFQNTPAFLAYASGSQTYSTATKITINTEVYDSDGKFDNSSNYRFTPTVAGKYVVYGQIYITSPGTNLTMKALIYKNGSSVAVGDQNSAVNRDQTVNVIATVDLDADDYVELYGVNSASKDSVAGSANTYFGAYKLIGI